MTTAQLTAVAHDAPQDATIRARRAIVAVFFLNGLTLASYIVRVPSLKADGHLSAAALGLGSTLFGTAAVLTMQFVGALVARYGSGPLIRLLLVALPATLVAVGFAHGFLGLAVAGVALGMVHATMDVSMNA